MTDRITADLDGGILLVRLNRAEKKNALTNGMYSAMADAIERADRDPDIRVVVFAGSGEVFTAGNDLGDFLENPPHNAESPVNRFIAGLVNTDVPLLSLIHI